MRLILVILAACIGISSCCHSKQSCPIEYISVLYDKENILRIVAPKSNDLIRWSGQLQKHGLATIKIKNPDSISTYRTFLQSMRMDTTVSIKTVLQPTILEDSIYNMSYSFYDNTNDINAEVMIVYYYKNQCHGNDTLFVGSQSGSIVYRLNQYRAIGDTVLWQKIRRTIYSY